MATHLHPAITRLKNVTKTVKKQRSFLLLDFDVDFMADFNNNWKYKYSIQSVFHQEEEKLHADPQSQNCEFQQVFAFVICQEQTLPNIGCQVYKSTSNDSDYIFLRCLRS